MKKILYAFLGIFLFATSFVSAQSVGRNLFITVYTPQDHSISFDAGGEKTLKPVVKSDQGYKTNTIIRKVSLGGLSNSQLSFGIKTKIQGKLIYHNVTIPFDSIEEMYTIQQVKLYITNEPVKEEEGKKIYTQVDEKHNIYISSNRDFSFTTKEKQDSKITIKYPNVLGTVTIRPAFLLSIIVFFGTCAYLLRKEVLIKIQ